MTTQQESVKTASKSTDGRALPFTGEEAATQASGMGEAVMKDSQEALKEITAGSHEWMEWARKAYGANLKAFQALIGCRTVKAAAAIHANLIQDHVKLMMDSNHRVITAMAKSIGGKPAHSK